MKIFLTLILTLASLLAASMDGKQLLEDKCSSCHMLNSSTKVKQTKISAPPMWGIMRKLDDNFSSREEAMSFMIDYVMNPSEEKMLFPQAAKKLFGLMPSMRKDLTDEELRAIAEYLYR